LRAAAFALGGAAISPETGDCFGHSPSQRHLKL